MKSLSKKILESLKLQENSNIIVEIGERGLKDAKSIANAIGYTGSVSMFSSVYYESDLNPKSKRFFTFDYVGESSVEEFKKVVSSKEKYEDRLFYNIPNILKEKGISLTGQLKDKNNYNFGSYYSIDYSEDFGYPKGSIVFNLYSFGIMVKIKVTVPVLAEILGVAPSNSIKEVVSEFEKTSNSSAVNFSLPG